MKLTAKSVGDTGRAAWPVRVRCPACRHRALFEVVGGEQNITPGVEGHQNVIVGSRRCPDPQCNAHLFVALDHTSGEVIVSYPPERVDFDASNVPPKVLAPFEEALTSHANQCYTASAIMVRKTIEELCEQQQATGDTLQQRLKALGSKVVLPKALLDGLDDLRLLGNDAVHVELKTFDDIGKDEVEVAIDLVKEVLKGVYQMDTLVVRLQAFKKQPPQPAS